MAGLCAYRFQRVCDNFGHDLQLVSSIGMEILLRFTSVKRRVLARWSMYPIHDSELIMGLSYFCIIA